MTHSAAAAAKPAKVSASKLRSDVYNLLDQIIDTGEPLEIERKGVVLKIMPPEGHPKKSLSKMDRLRAMEKEDLWIGDPNDIFHTDWLSEWREEWGIEE